MIYGDVCSGISAPTVAWRDLGWRCAFYSEIERFPRAVLKHHFPDVPLHGDFRTIKAGQYETIDLLVGGTPCQDFSVAGLRAGLAGDRGNLTLEFLLLADRLRPRWVVWENVPGVLSSNGGRDFGAFLGGLGELGYGWAYRTLDAQHLGVPQRRRRVFVVGHLGNWRAAAAVLFERHSLSGDSPPRREARQGVARPLAGSSPSSSGYRADADTADNLVTGTLETSTHDWSRNEPGEGLVPALTGSARGVSRVGTHALRADGFDASEDGTGRGTPLIVADPITAREANCYAHGGNNPRPHNVFPVAAKVLLSGDQYADAAQTGPIETLRVLRSAVDEETLSEWGSGVLAAFWPQEVLRSAVHGWRFRHAAQPERGLVNVTLSRSQVGARWSVRDLWQAGCDGCPPQGWQPSEQLASELGAYLSKLPYAPSPGERLMRDLWEAAEGAGVLRQALSAIQEARRSYVGQNQSVSSNLQVRRLVVEECEALQGFPRGFTQVPYRGKPAADGTRYKVLGNAMCVPVVRWIGARLQMVDDILKRRQ